MSSRLPAAEPVVTRISLLCLKNELDPCDTCFSYYSFQGANNIDADQTV